MWERGQYDSRVEIDARVVGVGARLVVVSGSALFWGFCLSINYALLCQNSIKPQGSMVDG